MEAGICIQKTQVQKPMAPRNQKDKWIFAIIILRLATKKKNSGHS